MITVEQAKKIVHQQVYPSLGEEMNVVDALGFVLAENILAPIAVPSFDQSAMDGYAFSFSHINNPMAIVEEVAAGDLRKINIKANEAVRIFTGAPVPSACDTVVMQELITIVDGELWVKDEGLKQGGNIRKSGSQIQKDALALSIGTKITAASIGFLSSLGLTRVKVYVAPKVTIIATGNELVPPGKRLQEGQIYESNTFMLQAALNEEGITPSIILVEDDKAETQLAISQALELSDFLLLSGGISVGDYDFVKEGLENNSVIELFYKVKQKPGKPLYFGKSQSCYVFALPGNPAAALTCYYEYARTAILKMMGAENCDLPQMRLPISQSLVKKEGRAVFYKALTDFKSVRILEGQGSDVLKSFSMANCLVLVEAGVIELSEGDEVEVHLIP